MHNKCLVLCQLLKEFLKFLDNLVWFLKQSKATLLVNVDVCEDCIRISETHTERILLSYLISKVSDPSNNPGGIPLVASLYSDMSLSQTQFDKQDFTQLNALSGNLNVYCVIDCIRDLTWLFI